MTICMIFMNRGGHLGFKKMPMDKILHTLRKMWAGTYMNSNQSSKKVCTPLPPVGPYEAYSSWLILGPNHTRIFFWQQIIEFAELFGNTSYKRTQSVVHIIISKYWIFEHSHRKMKWTYWCRYKSTVLIYTINKLCNTIYCSPLIPRYLNALCLQITFIAKKKKRKHLCNSQTRSL